MQCETCQGYGKRLNPYITVVVHHDTGKTTIKNPNGLPLFVPCPDCGGCGIMHCCEGPVGTEADLGRR